MDLSDSARLWLWYNKASVGAFTWQGRRTFCPPVFRISDNRKWYRSSWGTTLGTETGKLCCLFTTQMEAIFFLSIVPHCVWAAVSNGKVRRGQGHLNRPLGCYLVNPWFTFTANMQGWIEIRCFIMMLLRLKDRVRDMVTSQRFDLLEYETVNGRKVGKGQGDESDWGSMVPNKYRYTTFLLPWQLKWLGQHTRTYNKTSPLFTYYS